MKERTCPGLGPQDGQVHVGLPAINHGVGLPAGQLGPLPGRHHHLSQAEKTAEDFLAFLDKERKIERKLLRAFWFSLKKNERKKSAKYFLSYCKKDR